MAGNSQDGSVHPRTVLEYLLRHDEHTYEELAARFERIAVDLGESATMTPRHLRRLASGERVGATPVTKRVLRAMFNQSAETLLSPWTDARIIITSTALATTGAPANVGPLSIQDRKALEGAAERAHAFMFELSNTNVNGETMDQLHDDVALLAASYQRQPPSAVIGKLVSTQDAIFRLLEGRQAPANTRQLLLLAGVTSGLLAKISHDLAEPHSALTQTRTAFLCADSADHNGMRAWIRGLQSLIAYWAGRYRESVRYAQQGATFAPHGTSSVWLPLNEARAWAALGHVSEVQAAIGRAEDARESVRPDEVDELGGLCTFSPTRQLYYTAEALVWLPSEAATAESYALDAVTAYRDTNAPDWGFGDSAGSAADLAVARVHRGEIEGAAEALDPVLSLPTDQRIHGIVTSVNHVYSALTTAQASPAASQLQERIEEFTATPVPGLGA